MLVQIRGLPRLIPPKSTASVTLNLFHEIDCSVPFPSLSRQPAVSSTPYALVNVYN